MEEKVDLMMVEIGEKKNEKSEVGRVGQKEKLKKREKEKGQYIVQGFQNDEDYRYGVIGEGVFQVESLINYQEKKIVQIPG